MLAVLSKQRQSSVKRLTPLVYDDVDPALHPIAEYSLLAHLIKSEKDGLAKKVGDEWLSLA